MNMSREELSEIVHQMDRLWRTKNRRKAKLIFSTLKPAFFGDLRIHTNGRDIDGQTWMAYMERNWDNRIYGGMYLRDLREALEKQEVAA